MPLGLRALLCLVLLGLASPVATQQPPRYLYVVVHGADDDVLHRGVSLLVFAADRDHSLLRRIPLWPADGQPETVRGIAVDPSVAAEKPGLPRTPRLYVSTTRRIAAIDLASGEIVWTRDYGGHCCERMAVSPDGRAIYAPAFGSPEWYVIDAASGELLSTVRVIGWPRSTVYAPSGAWVYLAAWESNRLAVANSETGAVVREVGPFSRFVCPFTINRKGTMAFANVDGLVGFEVGDLQTGLILDRVEVAGYAPADLAKYECPSHGIAFTPDERELWIADGIGNRLRIFDSTPYPPVEKGWVQLATQPRWVTFSLDGRYAYSSTGDVVDVVEKQIFAALTDEQGRRVESGQMVEIGLAPPPGGNRP